MNLTTALRIEALGDPDAIREAAAAYEPPEDVRATVWTPSQRFLEAGKRITGISAETPLYPSANRKRRERYGKGYGRVIDFAGTTLHLALTAEEHDTARGGRLVKVGAVWLSDRLPDGTPLVTAQINDLKGELSGRGAAPPEQLRSLALLEESLGEAQAHL